ncbi:MAG: response regulator [Pirellulales bacterium]|nr:response regulator [Pirellulales bacterium]
MARENILVVEDEEEIQELVRYNLEKEGYGVVCVESGEEALRLAVQESPNLILLDLMLPGIDGLEVCRRLKRDAATGAIRIVMLTAKGEEADIVTGLEMGADDYITKPFSPRVLIARIRAVLRRMPGSTEEDEATAIRIHNLVIHPGRHEVLVDGQPVELTATEFRVLHVLVRRPGWVFTRYQIAGAVHGGDNVVTDRSVDVQIVGLRKRLGSAGRYIETVRSVGYRFKE